MENEGILRNGVYGYRKRKQIDIRMLKSCHAMVLSILKAAMNLQNRLSFST